MEKAYKGKRILLASMAIHNQGEVPAGQENYLWEYIVTGVNDNCEIGVIEFGERYALKDGGIFMPYICNDDEEQDMTIDNYKFSGIKDDHELFNVHLLHVNNATCFACIDPEQCLH